MDGGRSKPRRSRPGKTSPGVEKKTAKPREKKLGEFPGSEKMSLGIWKCRSPIWMNISDSNNWSINRGTRTVLATIEQDVLQTYDYRTAHLQTASRSGFHRPA